MSRREAFPPLRVGPAGAPGGRGASYTQGVGAPIAAGLEGDTYVDLATGNLYIHAGGAWTPTGATFATSAYVTSNLAALVQAAVSALVLTPPSIETLSDSAVAGPVEGDRLIYTGTQWANLSVLPQPVQLDGGFA